MLTPMRDLVPDKKKGVPLTQVFAGLAASLFFALLLRSIVHGYFFFPYVVKNTLMEPGLKAGTRVTIYRHVDPQKLKRGDILLLRHPASTEDEEMYFFARLVALPKESIAIFDRQVFINNKRLDTAWEQRVQASLRQENSPALQSPNQRRDQMPLVKLKKDEFFVLADNRDRGNDSRQFGPIRIKQIAGIVEAPTSMQTNGAHQH